jgi:hypothetical protein
MSVVVRFTPVRRDLIMAGWAAQRARPLLFAFGIGFFVVLPIVTAIFHAWIAMRLGRPIDVAQILLLLLIPPVMVGTMAYLPVWLAGRSRALTGEHTYRFGPEGMQFEGPGFDNRLAWANVTCYSDSAAGLMLFSDKLPLVSVPARVLMPETHRALLALLQHVGIPPRGKRGVAA